MVDSSGKPQANGLQTPPVPNKLTTLKQTWQENTLAPVVKRFPERKERFTTSSPSIVIQPLHTPSEGATTDEAADEYLQKLGFPGEFPFTRGVQPNMYRGRLWTMRQYAGFGSAAESNQRYHYLIEQGQTGLSVAFDLPTQIGYDADHDLALGEVGKVGVSISSLQDMRILLQGIPLDKVSVSMTINAPASILLAMVVAVAKEQGVPLDETTGHCTKRHPERVYRPRHLHLPAPALYASHDRSVPLLCRQRAKVEIPYRSAAIIFAKLAAAPSRKWLSRSLTPSNTCNRRSMSALDVGPFFHPRSASSSMPTMTSWRRSPSSAPPVACGAKPDAPAIRRHRPKQFGGCAFTPRPAAARLTTQQPDNNIVPRKRFQALAAILGGTQSLHTNSKDEALALPTEKAVEVALRTQQILAGEKRRGAMS